MNKLQNVCRFCQANLDGDLIWDTFYEKYSKNTEYTKEDILRKTEETSKLYGATKTNGRWQREIKILLTNGYTHKCPDCNNCHKHIRLMKTQ